MNTLPQRNESTVLVCKIGSVTIAIPSLEIEGIMDPRPVSHLPLTPDYAIGAFIHNGLSTSVIDLRSKFRLNDAQGQKKPVYILTLLNNSKAAAFYVDHVSESQDLPIETLRDLFSNPTCALARINDNDVYFTSLKYLLNAERNLFGENTALEKISIEQDIFTLKDVAGEILDAQYTNNITIVTIGKTQQNEFETTIENIETATKEEIAEPEETEENIEQDALNRQEAQPSTALNTLEESPLKSSDINAYDETIKELEDHNTTKSDDHLATKHRFVKIKTIEDHTNDKSGAELVPDDTLQNKIIETASTLTNKRKIYAIGATSLVLGSAVIYNIFYYPTAKDLRQSDLANETFFVIDEHNKSVIESVSPTEKDFIPELTDTIEVKANLVKTKETDSTSLTNSNSAEITPILSRTIKHVVKKGDTLWDLASGYLQDPFKYPEIADRNNIKNPDVIQPEQVVSIEVLK